MSPWTRDTEAQEVATALKDQIKGRVVLVTGVSPNSLGAETVRVVAPYASTIILASRTQSKIDETIKAAQASGSSAEFKSVLLDLASFDSVKKAAAEVNALGLPIDVVVNNAAVPQYPERQKTKEGFEAQFGANHLGHALFISLILPSVRAAAKKNGTARIVVVASGAHLFNGAMRFDDVNFDNKPEEYNKWLGYAQSKTANILYTKKLAATLAKDNILVFALHPGSIRTTNMGQTPSKEEFQAFGALDADGNEVPGFFKTLGAGTATQVIAAFDPELKASSGAYLNDAKIDDDAVAPYAKDPAAIEQLWTATEKYISHPLV